MMCSTCSIFAFSADAVHGCDRIDIVIDINVFHLMEHPRQNSRPLGTMTNRIAAQRNHAQRFDVSKTRHVAGLPQKIVLGAHNDERRRRRRERAERRQTVVRDVDDAEGGRGGRVLEVAELVVGREERVQVHQRLASVEGREFVVGDVQEPQAKWQQLEGRNAVVGDVEADELRHELEVAGEAQRVEGAIEIADFSEEKMACFVVGVVVVVAFWFGE